MAQWDNLGQVANIAQLLGMDALGLMSLVVQTAETARRHKRTCRQFAQHMKLVSDLLEKLQGSELIEKPATRRPLEQLEGALRRSLTLLLSCQKGGYLYRLFRSGKVARELREAQDEIDLYLRVFPLVALVALVDNSRPRGRLPDGLETAVKRYVAGSSSRGLLEFKAEIQAIANLQHKNIVRLLGCCIHREKKIPGICIREEENILVYEYMPNGSLDSVLFGTRGPLLKWSKRLQIIEGILQGILYLHKDSRIRVIHRDLKPRNILFGYEMNPKISDFGLAKMIPNATEEESEVSRVAGILGYIAPEYLRYFRISLKCDVYSFGVLFLEVSSGKKSSDMEILEYEPSPFLPGYVALLCAQEDPEDRPTMSNVAFDA